MTPPADHPPTELIQQPEASWMPVVTALGIALLAVGSFAGWVYMAFGAAIALAGALAWGRQSMAELNRLPREQELSAAVIEPTPVRGDDS